MNYPINEVITINKTQDVNGTQVLCKARFIRKWCIVSPENFIVAYFNNEEQCKDNLNLYKNHKAMIKTIGL